MNGAWLFLGCGQSLTIRGSRGADEFPGYAGRMWDVGRLAKRAGRHVRRKSYALGGRKWGATSSRRNVKSEAMTLESLRSWSEPLEKSGAATCKASLPTMSPLTRQWLAIGVALLVTLLILGLVTALSTTESDHDLRTMVAVGAAPRIRRRFLALQTGYHALIGAVLAVPLGALLFWAAIREDSWATHGPFGTWVSNQMVWPWPPLLAVLIGLPIGIGLVTALIFRSAPTVAPRRLG
jgi:hypothetical protein